jgi:hypothetical protein
MHCVGEGRERRVAEIMNSMGELADELVRTASRAEIAAWNADVRALSAASEHLGALHAQYNAAYLALLVADSTPAPRGVDACSL